MRGMVWMAVVASVVMLAAAGIAPRVAGPATAERVRVAAAALASPRAGTVITAGAARTAGDLARLGSEANRRAPGAAAAFAAIARGVRRTGGDLDRLALALPPATLPIAAGVAVAAALGAVLVARRGRGAARRSNAARTPRGRDRVLGMVAGGRPLHGVARQLGLAQDGVRVLLHTAALDRPHRPGRIFRPAGSAGAAHGAKARGARA